MSPSVCGDERACRLPQPLKSKAGVPPWADREEAWAPLSQSLPTNSAPIACKYFPVFSALSVIPGESSPDRDD